MTWFSVKCFNYLNLYLKLFDLLILWNGYIVSNSMVLSLGCTLESLGNFKNCNAQSFILCLFICLVLRKEREKNKQTKKKLKQITTISNKENVTFLSEILWVLVFCLVKWGYCIPRSLSFWVLLKTRWDRGMKVLYKLQNGMQRYLSLL